VTAWLWLHGLARLCCAWMHAAVSFGLAPHFVLHLMNLLECGFGFALEYLGEPGDLSHQGSGRSAISRDSVYCCSRWYRPASQLIWLRLCDCDCKVV
jgi:hypothetical protein